MRHISHLFEVQLCGGKRPFRSQYTHLKWPGSRKARLALDRAVGWMHIDDWKKINVASPVLYFQNTLAGITRNPDQTPGKPIVEQVLNKVFPAGFSAKLKTATLANIYDDLQNQLTIALADPTDPTGKTKPITPGFEDMLSSASGRSIKGTPRTLEFSGTGGGPQERQALEEALGAAFIDYFNKYDVDRISEGFAGYGGTDPVVAAALDNTFHNHFTKKLDDVNANSVMASVAMQNLAIDFGKGLKKAIADNPTKQLDPVFADLTLLIP